MLAPAQDRELSPDMLLPELFIAHPQARRVFDRYGLSGCGGALGPVESIGFFARTHGVELEQLLSEIRQAVAAPSQFVPEAAPALEDAIYRRYFLGGILVILTAGATWGAWLLWRIGFAGNFTALSVHEVNAHGQAQIYGWVGLFIMGFAYQAFPRMWHTTLCAPRLAASAFLLMLVGLVLRTVGMLTWSSSAGAWIALGGGIVQTLAIGIFVGQILLTFRRSTADVEPYAGFVIGALFFFLAQSGLDVYHTWSTMAAPTRDSLLWHVATFQAPLRDLQIHGLALFMILGVSIRMLPPMFDVPSVPRRRAWIGLAMLSVAVVGEVALFLTYRFSGKHWVAAFLLLPWLLLAGGCLLVALPWQLWRPLPTSDRSGKFVRAAYAWLLISLVMLLLLPVHQAASGIAFSHAYYGAIRHAITVGFVSLMILGIAAKVVPTLNGRDTRTLPALWLPFILVNLGCFLRVSLQALTDFYPAMFAVVGVSGVLEVTGIAIWGVHLARIIRQGQRDERDIEELSKPRPTRIEPNHIVADVLTWFPQTLEVFDHHGFGLLKNPVARRTMARTVTLSRAAAFRGVDEPTLLRALNEAIRG